jgi:hypothetical protein
MHRITSIRYVLADIPKKIGNATNATKAAQQPNIKPVKIDFALPDKVIGI